MADNLQNIVVPKNTWVDLYDLTGITVGNPLFIQNIGVCDVSLAVQAAQPTKKHTAYNVVKRDDDVTLANTLGDSGAWAYCNASDGLLAVSTDAVNGFERVLKVMLADGYGNPIASLFGALNIHHADVHRQVFNQFLHFDTATVTTLTAAGVAEENGVTVASVAGLAVGHRVRVQNGDFEPTFFQIMSITGNDLGLDMPLTFDHPIGATVTRIITNLAEPGLTTTATPENPIIFKSTLPPGRRVHLTTLTTVITDATAMDFTTFGGRAALTYGLVLQAITGGQLVNFTNWKRNLDLESDAFPVNYQEKVGGGEFGLSSAYGIKENTSAIVFLDSALGDQFRAVVQEPLTDLTRFLIKLQGHYEGR